MISHQHKFIFIHIPKTGGTSIEEALRDESCQLLAGAWDYTRARHAPLNHLTLQELADSGLVTPAQINAYFKFCFVRNPWDRLISEVSCRWMSPWFSDMPMEQRIRYACTQAAKPTGIANHLRPQVDFVTADGFQLDFIGRFEQLEEDFEEICRLLSIKATLPHRNRSDHRPYQEYYDAESQALTATTYQRDIAAFHYTFAGEAHKRTLKSASPSPVIQPLKPPNQPQIVTAYALHTQPVPLQPSVMEQAPAPNLTPAPLNRAEMAQRTWQLCCPVAFTACWNGGSRAEDITLHLTTGASTQPAFVQSNLGQGLLTFYPGYQFKTASDWLLWVRGPHNLFKDGLAPLESLVDASLLPCSIAIHWQFTRPGQTIHFAAGEPFATLLLYPQAALATMAVEIGQLTDNADTDPAALQQLTAVPAIQQLFQRLRDQAPPLNPPEPQRSGG